MESILRRLLRSRSGGFILVFHELSTERFATMVDSLVAFQAVHLSELLDRAKRGRSTSGLFAITFDDSIRDTVAPIARILVERSWPATFYIPTGYVDSGERMPFQWWQKIEPILPRRKIELNSGVLDFSQRGAVERFSKRMRTGWHTQRKESYLPIIMELVDVLVREEAVRRNDLEPSPVLTWSEIERLTKSELIRVESHGVSHSAMSALTDQELVCEMRHSRDLITEHTNRQCRHLAYPFGSRESIGDRVVSVAGKFYDSAVTMTLGSVDRANPLLLPRIPFYSVNSIGFAQLKVFLKCSALSPLKN